MCLLFETVRVIDGVPQYITWHEERMRHAGNELWGGGIPFSLGACIKVPPGFSTGVVRCNVLYGPEIVKVSFSTYTKRSIRSLKLVECPEIDYHLKYANRSALESLFTLRGSADDIVLARNGLITDTSIANLIFFDGKEWSTPAHPLLKGTCRNRLLSEGRLVERDIRTEDLVNYTGCKLINAMRLPEEEDFIPVSKISAENA
ncbi:MAG: aminotransferase class IV family protein [Bacteroidetes bacterium]|nr:aminotransferase class IV family protein [Bacteroidota bacterium]